MKESEKGMQEEPVQKPSLAKKVKGIIKKEPEFEKVTKTEEEVKEMVSFGKFLLRDLPLFKYELIIYAGLFGVAAFSWVLERFEFVPGAMGKALLPLIAIPFGIWLIKKQFYFPSKNRLPWIHVHGSRVVSFRTIDPRKGYIEIGPKENRKKIYLAKLNKHTEESTGFPCVVTTEFQGENINILKDTSPDMKSSEFNAILEMCKAVATKSVMKRMMGFSQPTVKSPLVILAIIQLFLMVILLIKSLNIF